MQNIQMYTAKKRCIQCEEKLFANSIFHQCGDKEDTVRFDNVICMKCYLVISLHNNHIMPYSSIKHCQCEEKQVKFK